MNDLEYIPFITRENSWDAWNANLAHYFSEQHIPVMSETNWREVANALTTNGFWARYNVPSDSHFDSWQDWADQFSQAVNGA